MTGHAPSLSGCRDRMLLISSSGPCKDPNGSSIFQLRGGSKHRTNRRGRRIQFPLGSMLDEQLSFSSLHSQGAETGSLSFPLSPSPCSPALLHNPGYASTDCRGYLRPALGVQPQIQPSIGFRAHSFRDGWIAISSPLLRKRQSCVEQTQACPPQPQAQHVIRNLSLRADDGHSIVEALCILPHVLAYPPDCYQWSKVSFALLEGDAPHAMTSTFSPAVVSMHGAGIGWRVRGVVRVATIESQTYCRVVCPGWCILLLLFPSFVGSPVSYGTHVISCRQFNSDSTPTQTRSVHASPSFHRHAA